MSVRPDWRILLRRLEIPALNRSSYRLIGRALALVLLVAQFGAGVHAYSHSVTDPAERPGAVRSCDFCLASSQLQIAVGAPEFALPVRSPAWTMAVPEPIVSGFHHEPFRAFRSRAPPAPV